MSTLCGLVMNNILWPLKTLGGGFMASVLFVSSLPCRLILWSCNFIIPTLVSPHPSGFSFLVTGLSCCADSLLSLHASLIHCLSTYFLFFFFWFHGVLMYKACPGNGLSLVFFFFLYFSSPLGLLFGTFLRDSGMLMPCSVNICSVLKLAAFEDTGIYIDDKSFLSRHSYIPIYSTFLTIRPKKSTRGAREWFREIHACKDVVKWGNWLYFSVGLHGIEHVGWKWTLPSELIGTSSHSPSIIPDTFEIKKLRNT